MQLLPMVKKSQSYSENSSGSVRKLLSINGSHKWEGGATVFDYGAVPTDTLVCLCYDPNTGLRSDLEGSRSSEPNWARKFGSASKRRAVIHKAAYRPHKSDCTMSIAVQPSQIPVTLSADLVSALNNPHTALGTLIRRDGTIVTVYVVGEVDAANEHSWRQLLREAAAATPPPGPLVIDTHGLRFMGGCAFNALADEADRCHSRGIRMCLVSRRPGLRRLVTATGLGSRLHIYPDADTALTADTWRSTAAGSLGAAHGN
jgi:anti-anti-sigma factor